MPVYRDVPSGMKGWLSYLLLADIWHDVNQIIFSVQYGLLYMLDYLLQIQPVTFIFAKLWKKVWFHIVLKLHNNLMVYNHFVKSFHIKSHTYITVLAGDGTLLYITI